MFLKLQTTKDCGHFQKTIFILAEQYNLTSGLISATFDGEQVIAALSGATYSAHLAFNKGLVSL